MSQKVTTMRDIWDNKKSKEKEISKESPQLSIGQVKNTKFFPPEIEKYYLEYLARRKAFLEAKEEIAQIFSDYESHLGEAGFFKI